MSDAIPLTRTCGRCQHFNRAPQALDMGMCRALPPSPTWAHDRAGNPVTTGIAWPVLRAEELACGVHFKPRAQIHA